MFCHVLSMTNCWTMLSRSQWEIGDLLDWRFVNGFLEYSMLYATYLRLFLAPREWLISSSTYTTVGSHLSREETERNINSSLVIAYECLPTLLLSDSYEPGS